MFFCKMLKPELSSSAKFSYISFAFLFPGVWENVYWKDSSQARASEEPLFTTARHGGAHEEENIRPDTRVIKQRGETRDIESLIGVNELKMDSKCFAPIFGKKYNVYSPRKCSTRSKVKVCRWIFFANVHICIIFFVDL